MKGRESIPSDSDIRSALHAQLCSQHVDEPDTEIIDELGLCRGQVRVDVAVVNGLLHGYEIKSDRDSLRRLAKQVEFYGRVLDRATLVVGPRHAVHASGAVPKWWGVLRADASADGIRLKTIRRARDNPSRDSRSLAELLWLDDAMALLEQRGATHGVRGKPRRMVWDRVCETLDLDEVASAVRVRLKARKAMLGPPSLS